MCRNIATHTCSCYMSSFACERIGFSKVAMASVKLTCSVHAPLWKTCMVNRRGYTWWMHMTDAHDKCTQHTSVIRFSRMSCVVFDLYALRAARLEHGGHTCRMQTISKHPMQALLKTHAQEPAVCIPKVEALEQDDAIKTKTHRKKVNEHRSCGN